MFHFAVTISTVHFLVLDGFYWSIIYTVLLHFTVVGTNSWIMNIGDKYYILPIQHFISYPLIDLLTDYQVGTL